MNKLIGKFWGVKLILTDIEYSEIQYGVRGKERNIYIESDCVCSCLLLSKLLNFPEVQVVHLQNQCNGPQLMESWCDDCPYFSLKR